MLVVVGNRRKHHERSAPLVCRVCWGPGHTWNVADIALRIFKALLNRTWFCTGGRRSCQSIQPVRHYAQGGCRRGRFCLTGAWYDVSVRGVQKHTLKIAQISWNWLALREPRIQSCCPQPPTTILSACHLSSMYSSAEATSTVTYWKHCEAFKSPPQWLCEFQRP